MNDEVLAAADNNARWCDAVCRSHGLATRFADGLWLAPAGSPRFYPDVVTLDPAVSSDDVLAQLPAGATSVKDSFASLDLTPAGFEVLFDAEWIVRRSPHPAAPALAWSAVDSDLGEWTAAAGLQGIIRASLLADPAVRVLGTGTAGAILYATGAVTGVSNVFYEPQDAAAVWRDLAALAPGPLVGYEHGDPLGDAAESGFSAVHPLRIWHVP